MHSVHLSNRKQVIFVELSKCDHPGDVFEAPEVNDSDRILAEYNQDSFDNEESEAPFVNLRLPHTHNAHLQRDLER